MISNFRKIFLFFVLRVHILEKINDFEKPQSFGIWIPEYFPMSKKQQKTDDLCAAILCAKMANFDVEVTIASGPTTVT